MTNTNDSGAGSLRQALADAAATPGWEGIAFASGLNGQTISLTTATGNIGDGPSAIEVTDLGGVAIDATGLPGGLTITKPAGDYRLILVNDSSRLSLHGLTLIGGSLSGYLGGAIYNNSGILRVHDCTFTGNQAIEGGGIYSMTFGANFTEIQRCTFTSNTATDGSGGAIRNTLGRTTVRFSTISGNSAAGPDGGASFDQRGFAIFGTPDKGAYETGTLTNYNAFIWKTLPATATLEQHAATFDYDGDGQTNEGEYIAGTIVTDPISVYRIADPRLSGVNFLIDLPTASGRTYRVEFTYDLLVPFQDAGVFIVGDGSVQQVSFPTTGHDRVFLRAIISYNP